MGQRAGKDKMITMVVFIFNVPAIYFQVRHSPQDRHSRALGPSTFNHRIGFLLDHRGKGMTKVMPGNKADRYRLNRNHPRVEN